jgi:PhzF family phenazine biosynthesis protein
MKIYQVDAFTSKPFAGNPAGVTISEKELPEGLMQDIAAEMNCSETAFLVKKPGGAYALRWFTPAAEVDLCGHATLASAHILFHKGYLQPGEKARFDTKSGRLFATYDGQRITLDFPAQAAEPMETPAGMEQALGCKVIYCGQNKMDMLVEVESEAAVRGLAPDITALSRLQSRGVIVTAGGDGESRYDFVSRFFAPNVGIAEDPVTGSAHCCLVPYWSHKLGRSTFKAYQASKRGGELYLRLNGERVEISGQAVAVIECEMKV